MIRSSAPARLHLSNAAGQYARPHSFAARHFLNVSTRFSAEWFGLSRPPPRKASPGCSRGFSCFVGAFFFFRRLRMHRQSPFGPSSLFTRVPRELLDAVNRAVINRDPP